MSSGDVPVYKLVLFKVLAALSDVSGNIKKVDHRQTGRVLLITKRQDRMLVATWVKKKKKLRQSLVYVGWHGSIFWCAVRESHVCLTSRGLVSLRKDLRSPPAISSSRINLGMACRLTPMHRTMFWWLNLLQGHKHSREDVLRNGFVGTVRQIEFSLFVIFTTQ